MWKLGLWPRNSRKRIFVFWYWFFAVYYSSLKGGSNQTLVPTKSGIIQVTVVATLVASQFTIVFSCLPFILKSERTFITNHCNTRNTLCLFNNTYFKCYVLGLFPMYSPEGEVGGWQVLKDFFLRTTLQIRR